MPKGFYYLIGAQFASGLADNALLILGIYFLNEQGYPGWWAPLLKFSLTLAYVLLASVVGPVADALMVLTEWKNFHNPDFQAMKLAMRTPYILDGRNLYNPDALADLGIAYQGVGRRNDLINLAVDTVDAASSALNA